jgi:lipopolysaccharide/colanic/teichoic acid biosynthesis glycosyltransferase
MKRENRLIIKRIFDIFVSGLALIFLLPIFAIIGIFIKLDSKGPIFFIQERVGKNGKLFKIYKLRTMYFDRYDDGKGLTNNDPRITRIGKYLRWGIDELPQLINVFKGDISLVGPRATVYEHVKK